MKKQILKGMLSMKAAAAEAGTFPETITRAIQGGRLPAVTTECGVVTMVRRKDLLEWSANMRGRKGKVEHENAAEAS